MLDNLITEELTYKEACLNESQSFFDRMYCGETASQTNANRMISSVVVIAIIAVGALILLKYYLPKLL